MASTHVFVYRLRRHGHDGLLTVSCLVFETLVLERRESFEFIIPSVKDYGTEWTKTEGALSFWGILIG